MIALPVLTTSLIHVLFKSSENVLFESSGVKGLLAIAHARQSAAAHRFCEHLQLLICCSMETLGSYCASIQSVCLYMHLGHWLDFSGFFFGGGGAGKGGKNERFFFSYK